VTTILVAACASHPSGPAVGVTDHHPGERTRDVATDGGLVDGAASLPGAYRASFVKVNKGRLVSQGHAAGRWEVEIWANDLAAKALSARSRQVPAGAIVVEEHFERTSDGSRPQGPIMVMEKRPDGFSKEHGDWRWAVVGSQGQLVKDGVIESCAGCHDDAPMDGLFPVVE
jgi:hypothetical protein